MLHLQQGKIIYLLTVGWRWSINALLFSWKRLRNLRRGQPSHILFCLVDHYEPGNGGVDVACEKSRVQQLLEKYPPLADRHRLPNGTIPKRTWFFPPHYHRNGSLKQLVSLCAKGYGEIELHLHHGKTQPDTSDNLRATLLKMVEEYSWYGIFGEENGRKRYGFIHGDWALDNSMSNQYCGVDDEISILAGTGCYADFTLPAPFPMATPRQINSIFYATDNPKKCKSHDQGFPVRVGGGQKGDLMIIPGPLYPFSCNGKWSGMRVFGDEISGSPSVTPARIDAWIKTGIHVQGKSNWIIIKMHTHGATDSEAVLGQEMDNIFSYLEQRYNDGKQYCLHYVTARELYNVIRAAEAGEAGEDPEKYRDYAVQAPQYSTEPEIPEASPELLAMVGKTYQG